MERKHGGYRGRGRCARLIPTMAAIALTAFMAAMTIVQAAPAGATTGASCAGSGCNGKDPYASGCAYGAYEVTSAGRYLRNPYGQTNGSVIHVFWSPRCQTNWPVVTQPGTCYNAQGTAVVAVIKNLSNGVTSRYVYGSTTAPTYVWGNMVYSPGPAQGYGEIDCNGPYDYSGWSGIA